MGDDDLSFPILFERAHDIFIGESMKSITPDSLFPKLAGQWKAAGHFRDTAMKRSIEAGNLRQIGSPFLDGFDQLYFARKMQRGQRNQALQIALQLGSDFLRRSIARSTMNNPVPNCTWL